MRNSKSNRPVRESVPGDVSYPESAAASASASAASEPGAQPPASPPARDTRGDARELERERIARRAYELWEGGDRAHGRDQEHWYAAERELQESPRSSASTWDNESGSSGLQEPRS